jgi:hypothetical protein
MTDIQSLLADKTVKSFNHDDAKNKKRKLDHPTPGTVASSSSSSSSSMIVSSLPTSHLTTVTIPRSVPSAASYMLDVDEVKSGFVLCTKIDPADWGYWLALGPLVREEYQVKGKDGKSPTKYEKQYVPIYRNPASLHSSNPTDPEPFKMFIKDVTPAFPLKPKVFDESGKASLNFQIELNTERAKLKELYEAKHRWILSEMAKHPDLKKRLQEEFRLKNFIHLGKEKQHAPDERYNSFIRYPMSFNRKKKEFDFVLFREGVQANGDPVTEAFIKSDGVKNYKCQIGVVTEKLTLAVAISNIYLTETCVSINLPERLPKFSSETDRVLPGCSLK